MENTINRRVLLQLASAGTTGSFVAACMPSHASVAQSNQKSQSRKAMMYPKAFVYTELQISHPFQDAPWQKINQAIKQQPGFLHKTWLSGLGNLSLGGFYGFASRQDAEHFVVGYFPAEAREMGVAQTTRIFDAQKVMAASVEVHSPEFGGSLEGSPVAFVYTELQVSIPFSDVEWRKSNARILETPGLVAKTWLSGLNNQSLGGFYVFDSVNRAQEFAVRDFPATAASKNLAFTAKVFEAAPTELGSRDMHSPYYR